MKLSFQILRNVSLVVLLGLFSNAVSLVDSPWSGHFLWTNKGRETEYGNVAQNVDLSLKDNNGNVDIGITISWHPGATVEIGATIPHSAITIESGPNGPAQILLFNFTDGFQNKGTGKITINGNTAIISLDATETQEDRATRQYGDYDLQRH